MQGCRQTIYRHIRPTCIARVPALLGCEHWVWAGEGGSCLWRWRAEDVVRGVQPGIDGIVIIAAHAGKAAGIVPGQRILGVVQAGNVRQVSVHC